ncbi:hypothetical protein [Aureispira anguillae]|uniref:Uncharacterized protein n=1 Tax=Aureispira anguillae TaxID=2864201 RepID=A0A916DS09_9BACT|nr:hypothetical protein [Aureispira anguillae]BDS10945.1 hypothetical protein AsAng_0016550 [Aureispira anguillae]
MQTQTNIHPEVKNSSLSPSFYEMIDKKATQKAGKDMMAAYQAKRKKAGKRGGVTPYTFDLFHAIIRSVAPTMENLKKHQDGLYEECRMHGEYCCFTTIPSLITLLNDTAKHRVLSPNKKTVYNQIKKLMDIGIITEKVNHVHTGLRNPYPDEQSPKGRGKIQLWISPQVLCIKPCYEGSGASDTPSFFDVKGETLPQYEQSSLLYKDKELESIINSPLVVDKAALAVAKLKPSNIQDGGQGSKLMPVDSPKIAVLNAQKSGEGQGSKSTPTDSPKITPRKASKKEHVCAKLWDLMRYNLYQNQVYNEQTNTDCKLMLGELLDLAAEHVTAYRQAKIQSFRENPAYLASRQQTKLLKNFAAGLPHEERSAIEIVSHAIIKQQKHADKYGYPLYYPVDYLSSTAAVKALNYSMDDWDRIQANYFDKNKTAKAYFQQVQWINKRYSNAIEQMEQEGAKVVYKDIAQHYNHWYQSLKDNPYLNEDKMKALGDLFIQKFKPLLNDEHLQRQRNGKH